MPVFWVGWRCDLKVAPVRLGPCNPPHHTAPIAPYINHTLILRSHDIQQPRHRWERPRKVVLKQHGLWPIRQPSKSNPLGRRGDHWAVVTTRCRTCASRIAASIPAGFRARHDRSEARKPLVRGAPCRRAMVTREMREAAAAVWGRKMREAAAAAWGREIREARGQQALWSRYKRQSRLEPSRWDERSRAMP